MNQPRNTRRPVAPRRHFALHPLSVALMLGFAGTAGALPNAGTVVSGQVSIQNPSANLQVVTQTSQRGIVDWQSFSIGSGQTVRFNQPNSSAVLLNRVTGYDPSQILGQMQANGRIFLLNPHGIVFGASARVDVGGMVASTLSLSNADFNAGRYQLTSSGGRGALRNEGVIRADGGTVALVAPKVSNAGTIEADGGRVGLAAADAVLVDVEGDGLVFFNASATGMKNRLEHLGRIQADGGTVDMRAAARASMADTVLNLSGVVVARGLATRDGVVVVDGGSSGITRVDGAIDASGEARGGRISVLGDKVWLDRNASLDASGASGGTVLVGGNWQGQGPERNASKTHVSRGAEIDASGSGTGDGGKVVVWADDDTKFFGRIDASAGLEGGDGGRIEVSGKRTLSFDGTALFSSMKGRGGLLLLDPSDITISNSASTAGMAVATPFQSAEDTSILNVDTLVAALTGGGTGTIVVNANTLGGSGGGTITVDTSAGPNDLAWNSGRSLELRGAGGITVAANSPITNSGTGSLNLRTDGAVTLNSAVLLRGGSFSVAGDANASALSFTAGSAGTITTAPTVAGTAGGNVTILTTGAISTRSINTTGAGPAGAAGVKGGNVQLSADDGSITVTGSITTSGGNGSQDSTAGNRVGGAGGTVTLEVLTPTAPRAISVTGTITTTGGTGGQGVDDGNDVGGTGGVGGAVLITTTSNGGVSVAAVNASGGVGGRGSASGNTNDGGVGGLAGAVTIRAFGAAGGASVTGDITARGGQGGQEGGAADSGGNGGVGGVVQVSSARSTVQVAAIDSRGGAVGSGGGANAGNGANITLSAGTDLTLNGSLLASTAGTTALALSFGTDDTGGVLTVPATASLTADSATYTGGAGVDTIAITLASGDTLTAAADSLTGTRLPASGTVTNVDRIAITTAATGSNTVTLTDWNGASGATVQLGGAAGSIAGTSDASLTTITGTGGQTFTINAANAGSVSGGPTFTSVGNLVAGGAGGGAFNLTTDAASILSVDGGAAGAALSLAGKTGAVTVNLQTATATDVTSFANIDTVTGNDPASTANTTLIGRNVAQTWNVTGANAGSVGGIAFTQVGNLTGGTDNDTFAFGSATAAAVTGNIVGGGAATSDVLDVSAKTGTLVVNLATGKFTRNATDQIGGTFSAIGQIVGNDSGATATTTLVGTNAAQTWSLTGAKAGDSSEGFTFSQVGNLTAGSGADTIDGAGGSLTGALSSGAGATELRGTITTGGTQTYAGAVTLGSPAVTVASSGAGASGNIVFGSTVDATTAGAESLTVNTQGGVSFGGAIGGTQRLASLSTDLGGTTALPATINTTGDVLVRDAASAATLTIDLSGPGNVTLGAGSDIDTLNLTVAGASAVSIADTDALAIGTFSITTGSASFTVGQSIVRTAALSLGGAPLTINVGGGADVDATVAGVFGSASANYTEVEISAGATAAQDNLRIAGTGVLGALVVTGNLVVDATGPISQTGALDVSGTSTFTALAQSVDLGDVANDFKDTVSIVTRSGPTSGAGGVLVRDKNSIELGTLTLGTGTLEVVAGAGGGTGAITQAPATSIAQDLAAGTATFTANGGLVDVTSPTNDFTGTVVLAGAGSLGVADLNDLTVDFTSFVSGTNTGVTAIAGGNLSLTFAPLVSSIDSGSGDINLQSRGGALNLGGRTLVTTTGDITLAADLDLNVSGISTGSGNLAFESVSGNVNLLQDITTGGGLAISSFGNVTAINPITSLPVTLAIGGAFSGSAGGSITVSGSFGALGALTATAGSIVVTDQTGGLDFLGDITAGGGRVSIAASGGGLVDLGSVTVTARDRIDITTPGAITGTGGALVADSTGLGTAGGVSRYAYLDGAGGLTLGSRTFDGQDVYLYGGGAGVSGTGAIDAQSGLVYLLGRGGAIDYTGTVTTTNATNDAVHFFNASSVQVGQINAASGRVNFGTIGSVGSVTQAGAITAGSLAGNSSGNVDLGAANQIGTVAGFTAGNGFRLVDSGTLSITAPVGAGTGPLDIATDGLLTVGASGALSGQGITLQASGINASAGLNAGGGDISIDGLGQNVVLGGLVQTTSNSATAVVIDNTGDVTLSGGVSTGASGGLVFSAVGGNVGLGANAVFSIGSVTAATAGNLLLDSTLGSVGSVGSIVIGGDFRLRDTAGGLNVTGTVDTNGGSAQITTGGALVMTGAVDATGVTLSGGSLALQGGNVAGANGTVQLTATAGNITQTAGTVTTSGALQVSATGSATFNNPVTVGSLGTGTVGGTLTLEHTGTLTVSGALNAGALDLTAANAIALNAPVTVTGTTTLDAGTTITQSAALLTGGLVVSAGGNVTLANTSNRIATLSGGSTGGAVSIFDSDLGLTLTGAVGGDAVTISTAALLALGANDVTATGGAISLTSVGLTGSGTIGATGGGVTISAGGGNVTLSGGQLTADDTTPVTIAIRNAGAVALGTLNAGTDGSVVLGSVGQSLGSVSQSGTITAQSLTGLSTGAVTLDQANAIGTLGNFQAGSLVLNDVGGLTVAGTVASTAGTLQITTSGPLLLGTSTVSSAGTLLLAGTQLSQTAVGGEVSAVGAATLDGGAGGIDLASDANSFGGAVTLERSAGAVTLHASGPLVVASLAAVLDEAVTLVASGNLTLDTGGSLNIGTADLTLEATNGNLSLNGDITANVLNLTAAPAGTISLGGNITTTGDQTYTSAVLFTGDVTMDAGSSKIALEGGATGAGGSLTLVSDNAAADAISTGNTIDSIGALSVQGRITLGGDVSGSGAQTYQNAVVLSAGSVTLSAGTGNVSFGSTIDGTAPGAQSLTVTTSGVTRFGGVVGGAVELGTLTTNGGGSTVLAGAGNTVDPFVSTSGDQLYDEATSIEGHTLLRANRVTFGGVFDANVFDIAFQVAQQTVFQQGVTGNGRIVLSTQNVTDSIGLAGAAGTLEIDQATLDQLAGFGTIVIGAETFEGTVTSNALVLPTNLLVRTDGGDVTFTSTILSSGAARNLAIEAGTGTVTFGGSVGNTGGGVLGTLNVTGDAVLSGAISVLASGAQTYSGDVTALGGATLVASTLTVGGTLTGGPGTLTLFADTIDVSGVGPGTGTVRLGGSTAATAIGIATADIANRLDLSQALLNVFGNAGNLIIGRDGAGTVTAQAFTLSTDTRIESASGAVSIGGAVNSATGTNHDLSVATAGLTTIGGAIGNIEELGALTIEGGSRLNGGSVRTVGAQRYEGASALGATTTLTGPSVTFGGTLDGAFGLTVDAATTRFGGAVGAGTALASLTTDAAGATTLVGNVSTTGAQTYNDRVVLGANATLAASTVTLAGSVNGARALQIDAAGGVTLGGSIGDTTALASLEVNGPTSLGAAQVSTTGAQTYAGSVTLTSGATALAGSALTFTSTVDGAADLVLQSSGATTFGGNVGGTTALRSIDSQGNGRVVLLGDSIRSSGAQSYAGALELNGNTTLQGGTLLFASGLSGAENLTLRTDALAVQGSIVGTGVLTIAPLSQGTTIGIAGGAGELQVTQAILNGADAFSSLVIGRSDGTGAITAGNVDLRDDTRIVSRTGDILLNGRVDGAVDLELNTGGTTRIAGPVGSIDALLSLTTDNDAAAADWNGTTGERTLFDAGGGRAVVTTVGNQTYNDPVVTTVPVSFSASSLVAAQTGNAFGAAVNLNVQTVTLRSGQTIDLGDVTITNGGTVETGGVLRLSGALRLEGGTLLLSSLATPETLAEFSDPELVDKPLAFGGAILREASATIDQAATASVSTAAGTLLVLRSQQGGSINLMGDNALLGGVSAVSGRLGDTDITRFDGKRELVIGFVRLNSTQINVAGAPPIDGDQTLQRAGIEADAVLLRADRLATGPDGLIRARLPFSNIEGSTTSLPGLTLVMSETALSEGGGFGSSGSDTWIQVSVGDERGGFLTVRPKGENGPNAFILLGGNVDARPFYDGAGKITEVRVFYNGDTPRTAQESGALSAVQALAEDARQSRFEEAVRTENVRQRLRSGVIAEVGAGRPATVGRESIKLPENCEPKVKSLECQ